MREKFWKEPVHKDWHRHFGGEVRKSDFYDAAYYSPARHLRNFLKDWDWDLRMQEKAERLAKEMGDEGKTDLHSVH